MAFSYAPYAKASAQYLPAHTKLLIIQEAPPYALERHFYFTDVRAYDGLWVNFTRYAYKADFGDEVAAERKRKDYWLGRCKADGYQVIDSMREPIARNPAPGTGQDDRGPGRQPSSRSARKSHRTRSCWPRSRFNEGLAGPIAEAGLPLVNEEALPFPGRGQQLKFLAGLDTLIEHGRLKMPT